MSAAVTQSNLHSLLSSLAECVEGAIAPGRLRSQAFARSPVPMALVDGERRFVEVNPAARLVFRHTAAELRRVRLDDITPEDKRPAAREVWARLLDTSRAAGVHELSCAAGPGVTAAFYAAANALPGLHLIGFAPAGWTRDELLEGCPPRAERGRWDLTNRELEVLELAADGQSSKTIAEQLVLSPTTVKTHFERIYRKLGVHDRAGAVAKALRSGLIA